MTEAGQAPVYRGNLEKLVAAIRVERGIDLGEYRRAYVERRLAARMRAVGVHSYRQYTELLAGDDDEFHALMDTLTINVTEFFRDRPVWDIIKRKVLTDLIAQKTSGRSRTIRVWSAGCATGEEPYSLAMLLLDVLGAEASRYLVSVTGTDLDPKALATAEKGIYPVDSLRRIPASYQVRFMQTNGSFVEMAPEVKRIVRFSQYNLFEPSAIRMVDLLVCRNVFIYFDRDRQAKVLDNFYDSLARGGFLVLGRSEKLSPESAARLEVIDGRERVYRKPARA